MAFRVTATLKCGNTDPPVTTEVDFLHEGTGAEAWRRLVDKASSLSASIIQSRIVSDKTGVVHLTHKEYPERPAVALPMVVSPPPAPVEAWPGALRDLFHVIGVRRPDVKEFGEHASFT